MKKIKIIKLDELIDARHPNNIPIGYVKILNINTDVFPKIGERFPKDCYWSTSVVQEIINEHEFKTLNSIYYWEEIDE
jgi:hypothetical protein